MRVLVTGGSGKVGRWVLRELLEHGHEVINADRRPLPIDELPEDWRMLRAADYRQVDLTDVGQVAGAMSGCDAFIHLAAIPSPVGFPDEIVFRSNVETTFSVFQAASLMGVRRSLFASSLAALGITYAPTPFPPLYAPVDEEHPLLVADSYALAKEVDERIGEMFHRRSGMEVLALRFHWVMLPEETVAMAARVAKDPTALAHLFWGYVDVRDVADACRRGVERDGIGFEVVDISAADTLSETPTEELLRRHCPDVEIREAIPGTTTAFSNAKAARVLGYAPRHSWRSR